MKRHLIGARIVNAMLEQNVGDLCTDKGGESWKDVGQVVGQTDADSTEKTPSLLAALGKVEPVEVLHGVLGLNDLAG